MNSQQETRATPPELDISDFVEMKYSVYEDLQIACSKYLEISKNLLKSGKYVDLVEKIKSYFHRPDTKKYPLVIQDFMAYCFLVALNKMLPTYQSVDFYKLVKIALQEEVAYKKVKDDPEFNLTIQALINSMKSIVDASVFTPFILKENICVDFDKILAVYLGTLPMLSDDYCKLVRCIPKLNYAEMLYAYLCRTDFKADCLPGMLKSFQTKDEKDTFFIKLSNKLPHLYEKEHLDLYHELIEDKSFLNFLNQCKEKELVCTAMTRTATRCIDLRLLDYVYKNMPSTSDISTHPSVKDKQLWLNSVIQNISEVLVYYQGALKPLKRALNFLLCEGEKLSVLEFDSKNLYSFLPLAITANNQKIVTQCIPLWILKSRFNMPHVALAFQRNPEMLHFVIKEFKNTEGIDKLFNYCLGHFIDSMANCETDTLTQRRAVSILVTYPNIATLLKSYPAHMKTKDFDYVQEQAEYYIKMKADLRNKKEAEKIDLLSKFWIFFKPAREDGAVEKYFKLVNEYMDREMEEDLSNLTIS